METSSFSLSVRVQLSKEEEKEASDSSAEAYEFLEIQVETLNNLQSQSERRQMHETLSSFLTSIERHGRASPTYKSFYSQFSVDDGSLRC